MAGVATDGATTQDPLAHVQAAQSPTGAGCGGPSLPRDPQPRHDDRASPDHCHRLGAAEQTALDAIEHGDLSALSAAMQGPPRLRERDCPAERACRRSSLRGNQAHVRIFQQARSHPRFAPRLWPIATHHGATPWNPAYRVTSRNTSPLTTTNRDKVTNRTPVQCGFDSHQVSP
jgi:hypothetical protein